MEKKPFASSDGDDGYREAQVIDKQIDKLLKRYPVDCHLQFWLAFCRTVSTGLDLIHNDVKDQISDRLRAQGPRPCPDTYEEIDFLGRIDRWDDIDQDY